MADEEIREDEIEETEDANDEDFDGDDGDDDGEEVTASAGDEATASGNDETSARVYLVSAGTDTQEIEGRPEAVALAKQLSADDGLRVTVERADGMETMQFINGGLETFVCETRDRRKSRPRT